MSSPPPRLAPTVALAVLWVALYLLYLSVKPAPVASPTGRDGAATTTTSVTSEGSGEGKVSRRAVPAEVPDRTR